MYDGEALTDGAGVRLNLGEEALDDGVCVRDFGLALLDNGGFWLSYRSCEGGEEDSWQGQEGEEAGLHSVGEVVLLSGRCWKIFL